MGMEIDFGFLDNQNRLVKKGVLERLILLELYKTKMTTYIIITISVILVIVILNSIKYPSKADKLSLKMKEMYANPHLKERLELFSLLESLNKDGTDKDVMPEGVGEFGLDITNPIPVNTIFGSNAYLGKLLTTNGSGIEYERIASVKAPNISSLIDSYNIKVKGEQIAVIYICPYNKKNSNRAPKGFKIRGSN